MENKGETQAENIDHDMLLQDTASIILNIYKIYMRKQDHWYLETNKYQLKSQEFESCINCPTGGNWIEKLGREGNRYKCYWGSSSIFLLLFTFISSMGWMGMVGSVSAMGEEDEDSARDV